MFIESSRRSFITGLSAVGAMGLLQSGAVARPTRSFFDRIGRPLGLQLYTLGDEAGKDIDATFARVSAFGYRDIELPGLYGRSPADIRAAADRAGVAISSLHLAAGAFGKGTGLMLTSPVEEIAASLKALGADKAVMPIMIFPANIKPEKGETFQSAIGRAMIEAGPDIWKRTASMLNERAAALKPFGIRLGYHNHNLEFAPVAGTTGWDILMAECDRDLIHFEVDAGWIATAGLDPVAFLRKHAGRVLQMHVKDVAAGNTQNFALSMKPAEVGSGVLDWARILPAAYKAGVRNFYVEQEPPFTIPRMEAARRSADFLTALKA
ncbi:sugar phosphate isomerase/epimerase family protein [Sphingobium boeckii]|uniref:Sugar phosphate isomerase/epimerase n=1 Tax=Sphingobium boeckii TaxID=1082345 RepID=A0A7W9AI02_9SPHN|nr:sugar phosphate isomerase/epimerase [Sphingobium boeckii]MBB5685965.1 sugar phosphate isomerase/epimerase [Sphingobium boeckii]